MKTGNFTSTSLPAKKMGEVLIVMAILAAFPFPAYSNEALRSLQQGANNLMNGGTLILSKSCEIDGTLLIRNKSNIIIDGNNETITQLKHNTITIKIVNCNSVIIKDLVLIGDPYSYEPFKVTNGVGICMQSCQGKYRLDRIKFYDHGCTSFKGINVSNITFNQCLFNAENVRIQAGDAYNCGILSNGRQCSNWEINNCIFEKMAMGMILTLGHDRLNIHDNKFADIQGQHGIYLNASSYVNIYNNTFANIYGIAIKLQMNNGHDEIEREIKISNNICNVELSHNRGQAGIAVGAAQPQGPAKGVFWKNVRIENNRVNRFNYGVSAGHVKDAKIIDNTLTNTVYGVLVKPYSGSICNNTITTTEWSGIFCNVIDDSMVDIIGNVIRDPVHINSGDTYKRCGIVLTGSGAVSLENNEIYKNSGEPLFGLYQGPEITLTRYHNNRLIGPVGLKGKVVWQAGNVVLSQ